MELNLPVFKQLSQCRNLLIAGMGGGYDIFCGLPIYFALKQRGQQVHLANFSFSDIEIMREGVRISSTLLGATANQGHFYPYFPEFHLSEWFKETQQQEVTIWCFAKTGTAPLLENYRLLTEHLNIDGILLIDGGVDSLMRGDEAEMGTLVEDAISLFVVNELNHIPLRMLACLGFGAEQDMTYSHVLENIAALTQNGGFLGSCALTPQMEAYGLYEQAVLYVQGKPYQDSSVINSSIISAVQGYYGNYHLTEKTQGSRLWISPFMSLYWFFSLESVVEHNLFLPQIRETQTFRDAVFRVLSFTKHVPKRPIVKIPL